MSILSLNGHPGESHDHVKSSMFSVRSALDGPVESVMFVCTGNICRSPYAELLLRHLVPGLQVSSAGTHALAGHPMDELMAAQITQRGVDPTSASGSQLGPRAPDADLVLVMSSRHRKFLIEEYPGLARRVGLLGAMEELTSLVPDDDVLLRSHVAQWSRQRPPEGAEIEDPYRLGPKAAAAAASRIDTTVTALADVLAEPVPTEGAAPGAQ